MQTGETFPIAYIFQFPSTTYTSSIMHLISPSPASPTLRKLCFSFLLGITAVQRKIENNAYAKILGRGGECKWRINPVTRAFPLETLGSFPPIL